VRVVVRCRPLSKKEEASGCKVVVNVDERTGTLSIKNEGGRPGDPSKKDFSFDRVFAPGCKQVDVYNDAARPIVESVLEGYNGESFTSHSTGVM
jgi:kinesin family protein 3/17